MNILSLSSLLDKALVALVSRPAVIAALENRGIATKSEVVIAMRDADDTAIKISRTCFEEIKRVERSIDGLVDEAVAGFDYSDAVSDAVEEAVGDAVDRAISNADLGDAVVEAVNDIDLSDFLDCSEVATLALDGLDNADLDRLEAMLVKRREARAASTSARSC